MRHLLFAAWSAVFLMGTFAWAAPATSPAETPRDVATTQPAAVEPGRVLILPFTTSSGVAYPWLSQAIQQDIGIELSEKTRAQIDAPSSLIALDTAAALQRGREAHATHVIQGQYQVIGDQIRLNGEVFDVATGKPVGSFFATGPASNLFPLESSLTNQVLRELPPGWLTVSLPSATQNPRTEPSTAVLPAAPDTAAQPPGYYSYTYPDYVSPAPYATEYRAYADDGYPYYAYPAPYYWYSVPYYGPDIWFFGDFDFYHHHHWHNGWHDWDHHEFEHGVPHGFSHGASGRPSGGAAHGGGGSHGGSGSSHAAGGSHRGHR